MKQEIHPVLCKDHMNGASDLEEESSKKCSSVSKAKSFATVQWSKRLYSLSKKKQDEGKKRREAIALASLKRKQTRDTDSYGVLPAHKSGDMYLRGVTKILEREEYLEQCRVDFVEEGIRKRQEFKLAEGAFANCDDAAFQARVFQNRYGRLLDLDEQRYKLLNANADAKKPVEESDVTPSTIGMDEYSNPYAIPDEIKVKMDAFTPSRGANNQYRYSKKLLEEKNENISNLVDIIIMESFTKLYG